MGNWLWGLLREDAVSTQQPSVKLREGRYYIAIFMANIQMFQLFGHLQLKFALLLPWSHSHLPYPRAYSKCKEKVTLRQFSPPHQELLHCRIGSCVDASLNTAIVITSNQRSLIMYLPYTRNLNFLQLSIPFISHTSILISILTINLYPDWLSSQELCKN